MFMHADPIKEAVTNGADWLDQVYPEWVEHINLEHLRIASPNHCILGQVFGWYCNIVKVGDSSGPWSKAHGFTGSIFKDSDEGSRCLDAAWKAEITMRRELANV